MKNNHTAGEWTANQAVIKAGKIKYVPEIHLDNFDSQEEYTQITTIEAEANAKLIAAAPSMLEAFRKILFEATLDEDGEDDYEGLVNSMNFIKDYAETIINRIDQ